MSHVASTLAFSSTTSDVYDDDDDDYDYDYDYDY